MMTRVLILASVLALASPALANQPVNCKGYDEAAGKGYEARISNSKAEIFRQGEKIADLDLSSNKPSPGGDQYSVRQYVQNAINGFKLTYKTGGLGGFRTATIYHGGVAGYTQEAELYNCK